jgi:hypothetical protein
MKKTLFLFALIALLFSSGTLSAQTEQPKSLPQELPPPFVRKTVGYLSFIIPVATYQGSTWTTNFTKSTTIGFPFGVNIYYSEHFGFSLELTPNINWQHPTGKDATSKVTNLIFDPGPIFRFSHHFNIIPRLAFESSGRYGITPVFNKVFLTTPAVNYFISGSIPMRVGNDAPFSIGFNVQIGFIFN